MVDRSGGVVAASRIGIRAQKDDETNVKHGPSKRIMYIQVSVLLAVISSVGGGLRWRWRWRQARLEACRLRGGCWCHRLRKPFRFNREAVLQNAHFQLTTLSCARADADALQSIISSSVCSARMGLFEAAGRKGESAGREGS